MNRKTTAGGVTLAILLILGLAPSLCAANEWVAATDAGTCTKTGTAVTVAQLDRTYCYEITATPTVTGPIDKEVCREHSYLFNVDSAATLGYYFGKDQAQGNMVLSSDTTSIASNLLWVVPSKYIRASVTGATSGFLQFKCGGN